MYVTAQWIWVCATCVCAEWEHGNLYPEQNMFLDPGEYHHILETTDLQLGKLESF